MANIIKQIEDKEGNKVLPITHVDAVRDSAGTTLPEILDRDYPTTSKTPVEGSTEVSLVTRGEKYEWNKVGNAADASSASDITSNFKYLLLNGTTGEFETALKAYVEESVRAALGPLINNLDKGTGIKALAGIDANNDLGSITTANLASVLSAWLSKDWGVQHSEVGKSGDTFYAYGVSGYPTQFVKVIRLSDGGRLGISSNGETDFHLWIKWNNDYSWTRLI